MNTELLIKEKECQVLIIPIKILFTICMLIDSNKITKLIEIL